MSAKPPTKYKVQKYFPPLPAANHLAPEQRPLFRVNCLTIAVIIAAVLIGVALWLAK